MGGFPRGANCSEVSGHRREIDQAKMLLAELMLSILLLIKNQTGQVNSGTPGHRYTIYQFYTGYN